MSFIINPYNFASGVVPTVLLSENFEGPGATGWTTTVPWNDTYDVNPDFYFDNYGGEINGTTTAIHAFKAFTPSPNVYCRFSITPTRYITGGAGTLATFKDASGNTIATFGLANTTNYARSNAGGSTINATIAPDLNDKLYGWFEYEKGTGSNAKCRVGFEFGGMRPAWPTSGALNTLAVSINGTATANAARIMFGTNTAATNYAVVLDNIEVRNTPWP
jgi:hypothetical protein